MATAVRDAGFDSMAIGVVDKVKVIEVMGRNTGWITATSALARQQEDDPPHLVYLPERPLNIERFLADVQTVYDQHGFVVIAACEGIRGEDGQPLNVSAKAIDVDAFGHVQMGGVADFLCRLVSDRLKLKARFDKPGTIQRVSMALASTTDLEEAYLVGQMAVRHAVAGVSDRMVTLEREPGSEYRCTTGLVKLEKVANAEKLMPDEYIGTEGNDVTPAFLDYVRPLIGEPLPEYARLQSYLLLKLVSK